TAGKQQRQRKQQNTITETEQTPRWHKMRLHLTEEFLWPEAVSELVYTIRRPQTPRPKKISMRSFPLCKTTAWPSFRSAQSGRQRVVSEVAVASLPSVAAGRGESARDNVILNIVWPEAVLTISTVPPWSSMIF